MAEVYDKGDPFSFEPEDISDANGEAPPHRPHLGLIPFVDIHAGNISPYLVKDLIPREGLTVVWGEPKSGKSFQTFDLAMAVARGVAYRGRRIQQGPVVYCAAEGATGFRNRVEAYRRHHELESDLPFYLVPDTLDLIQEVKDLAASIRTTLGETNPVMVVIDTLNRSLNGSENDPADMGAYIKAGDIIREAFRCAVLIVHHCGTEGKRPRGHSALEGAVEAKLAVKRTSDNVITTTDESMKDGPEGESIYSTLQIMTVGHDCDGDEITSCVVLESKVAQIESCRRAEKLTPNQQTMLTVLQEAMPHGITVEHWNEQAKDAGLCEGQKGQRRRFYELRIKLKSKKLVHETQGRWFVTTK